MNTTQMSTISVKSTIDSSIEPNLFYYPKLKVDKPIPLVVGLHTWSFDRYNQEKSLLPLCKARKWALLLPEFRGPNKVDNPRARESCGSTLAKQDIIDAINHISNSHKIDRNFIFLIGGSGGGHMALLTAAYKPDIWQAVSAWVPVTDLPRWRLQNKAYKTHIESCCGGTPEDSKAQKEYHQRSPINFCQQLSTIKLLVHHGKQDPSIDYLQTLSFIEKMKKTNNKNFFWEIFDGAHEIRNESSFIWFDQLVNNSKNEPLTG